MYTIGWSAFAVACEPQTHFRSSLLSLRKIAIFGGRNASAVRRLLLLLLRQEIEILRDVALHVLSDGDSPSNERLPKFPDQLFRIFATDVFELSVQNVCQWNRNRHSFSNSRSFVTCSRLIASSSASKSYTMGCWNISTTKYLRRQLSSNPLLEMVSDQRKMTFVDPNPSNSMTAKKACSELTSFCLVLNWRCAPR